jgi:small subunit ribosomal protein S2
MARSQRARGEGAEADTGADEPLAEWEQELLTSGTGSDGASLPDAPVDAAADAPPAAATPTPAASTNGTQQNAG